MIYGPHAPSLRVVAAPRGGRALGHASQRLYDRLGAARRCGLPYTFIA